MKKIILFTSIFCLFNIAGYSNNNNDKKKKQKKKTEQTVTTEKRICIYTSLPVLPQTVFSNKDISAEDLQPQIDPIYRCGNVHEYDNNTPPHK